MRGVTPLAGVWIEIGRRPDRATLAVGSLPSRECGLKYERNSQYGKFMKSLPSRECGLKLLENDMEKSEKNVTPLAGVWIEIRGREVAYSAPGCHSPRGSVD